MMSWARRSVRRWLRPLRQPHARFVFDRRFAVPYLAVPMDPHRAENVAAFLQSEELVESLLGARPASLASLRLVHDDAYLQALQDPTALSRVMGFDVPPHMVDQTLQLQRLIVGGTKHAVQAAVHGVRTVASLVGGLHHARPAAGHGFCAFNDVAIAIRTARSKGFASKVLIVDCDLHDGDGTRLCFKDDPSVHTYSLHNLTLDETAAIEATTIALGGGIDDRTYMEALERSLPAVVEHVRPRLVIYVAGVDLAHDDRLGNWKLTADGLIARDRFVMRAVRAFDPLVPVVVVAAGGYGANAWRYQARFYGELARGRPIEPPPSEAMTLTRMHLIRDVDDPIVPEIAITEADVYGDLGAAPKEHRFLGFYTLHMIELSLERYGIFDRLRALGFAEPTIEWNLDDPIGHRLRIYGDAQRRERCAELCVRKSLFEEHPVLSLEWLLLQNPRKSSAERPLLPGQRHPGLGMVSETVGLLIMVCERLQLAGIVFVPGHYHLAAVGAQFMRFVDPKDEALVRSLHVLRGDRTLAEMSWALAQGHVLNGKTRVTWTPKPMVLAVSDVLRAGEEYERAVVAAQAELELSFAG